MSTRYIRSSPMDDKSFEDLQVMIPKKNLVEVRMKKLLQLRFYIIFQVIELFAMNSSHALLYFEHPESETEIEQNMEIGLFSGEFNWQVNIHYIVDYVLILIMALMIYFSVKRDYLKMVYPLLTILFFRNWVTIMISILVTGDDKESAQERFTLNYLYSFLRITITFVECMFIFEGWPRIVFRLFHWLFTMLGIVFTLL